MSNLASTQTHFQDWLIGGEGVVPPPIKNADGLAIYHHAYRARLRDALAETFDKTWGWIGDEAFDQAVADYVKDHPSGHRSLDQFGDRFANFLTVRFRDDPEVAEIALIEWLLHFCFSGPDAELVDQTALATVNWESAHLTLVPTYKECTLTTNAAALWRALADNQDPPDCTILEEPVRYRIWRKDFSPHFKAMDDFEAHALHLVRNGHSFAEACAVLSAGMSAPLSIAKLGALLASWFQDGLISAITICDI